MRRLIGMLPASATTLIVTTGFAPAYCPAGLSLAGAQGSSYDEAEWPFKACLISSITSPENPPVLAANAPGLSRIDHIRVNRIATKEGALYVYRGEGHGAIVCGIPVNGVDSGRLKDRLLNHLKTSLLGYVKDLTPHDAGPNPVPAKVSYWGDPGGTGLDGVWFKSRMPAPSAPSLEVAAHRSRVW